MTFRLPLGRLLYLALIFLFAASAFGYGQRTRVIVRSTGSREALKERVQALGGRVRHEFSSVTAVSADVPTSALTALASSPQFKVSKNNNLHALGLSTVRLRPGDPVNFQARNLVPGEQQELLLEIDPRLGSVQIQVNSVTPRRMPEKQNQIFGDDVLLAAHQSELSAAQGDDRVEGDYPVFAFVHAPGTFTINHPETGFMRVVLYGDWTNAGKVSADITITGTAKPESRPAFKREGKLSEGEVRAYAFNVPDGATAAQFQLAWEHDWRHYPTNDIDLVLIDPAGNEIDDGATVSTPETVSLDKPMSGIWTMYVIGFDIFGHLQDDATERGPQTDFFTLTASLD